MSKGFKRGREGSYSLLLVKSASYFGAFVTVSFSSTGDSSNLLEEFMRCRIGQAHGQWNTPGACPKSQFETSEAAARVFWCSLGLFFKYGLDNTATDAVVGPGSKLFEAGYQSLKHKVSKPLKDSSGGQSWLCRSACWIRGGMCLAISLEVCLGTSNE